MRKIFTIFGLILVVVVIALLGRDQAGLEKSFVTVNPSEVDRSRLSVIIPEIILPTPRLSLPSFHNSLVSQSWNVFENYLKAVKNHDLESLQIYSHQTSDTCKDSAREAECFALMDNVYELGKDFNKDDFIHVWADEKQIILSTDYNLLEDNTFATLRGLIRSVIYFTIIDENPKVLYFSNFDGTFLLQEDFTADEIDARLRELVRDTDEDGLPDEIEICAGLEEDTSCVKTDPKKRDSDGDGWWDGVEIFFYM